MVVCYHIFSYMVIVQKYLFPPEGHFQSCFCHLLCLAPIPSYTQIVLVLLPPTDWPSHKLVIFYWHLAKNQLKYEPWHWWRIIIMLWNITLTYVTYQVHIHRYVYRQSLYRKEIILATCIIVAFIYSSSANQYSLKEDGGLAFSSCLNGTFPWRNCSLFSSEEKILCLFNVTKLKMISYYMQ